jgi:hypothetical protein
MRMRKKRQPLRPWLPKKAERGFHGYPIATIAFYGPTDKLATKVAVSIILAENHEPDLLERWFSESGLDVRHDLAIGEQVVDYLKTHAVRSTVVADPEVTCCSSVPCRPQTPWCGG